MGHECNRPKELAAFLANPGTHSRVLFEHRRYMRFLIGARVVGFGVSGPVDGSGMRLSQVL